MRVASLDHYNLRASRDLLEELRDFYCDIVGLSEGDRPAFRGDGYWLYAGDRAVLHLSVAADDDSCPPFADSTFDHAAFACAGRADYERRLAESNVTYRTAVIPGTGRTQLFFVDPAGNGVELNFAEGDA